MEFRLHSEYKPTGDQPKAIDSICRSIESGNKNQTLLGVTGSGKTFTMANIIAREKRPTLVLAHNKTLAAQLCSEFKEFFPKMRLNILSAITTTTSPKHTSHRPIPILKRTAP